jgi:hypothetical protein
VVKSKSTEPTQIDLQTEHVVQERDDVPLDFRVKVGARHDYAEPGRIWRLNLSDSDF